MRNAHKLLIEKTEGMELLGKSRSRWKNNNNLKLKGLTFNVKEWMNSLNSSVYYMQHNFEH